MSRESLRLRILENLRNTPAKQGKSAPAKTSKKTRSIVFYG